MKKNQKSERTFSMRMKKMLLPGMLMILMSLAGCGAQQNNSSAATLPTLQPTDRTSAAPLDPTDSAPYGSEEEPGTSEPLSPVHPTDTEYVGPAFDYTRAPGKYILTGEDFGITRYISPYDADGDGIDDQTDIVLGAKAYLAQKPQYNASSYFRNGYPEPDENGVLYGVCTDVVGAGLLAAGYDLRALVDADIENHPEWFTTELADQGLGPATSFEIGDSKIDFRRVRVLYPFFEHRAEKLTTDLSDPSEWQPGDIVIFFHATKGIWEGHIVVLSDRRAEDGVPYVLHHSNPGQTLYEEDYMVSTQKVIVGHYRWNGFNGE